MSNLILNLLPQRFCILAGDVFLPVKASPCLGFTVFVTMEFVMHFNFDLLCEGKPTYVHLHGSVDYFASVCY